MGRAMSSCDYIRALRPNAVGRCGVGMAKAFVSLLVGRYCAGLSTTPLNGSCVEFSGLDGAWQHANYKEGPALSPRLSSSIQGRTTTAAYAFASDALVHER